MTVKPRHSAFLALALLFSSALFGQQKPWDAPPFTADPKALVAAAQKVEANDFANVMLLDESSYWIDAEGNTDTKERVMMYVVAEAGVEVSDEVRASWQPWFDERPGIEARVITRDGTVHVLDQKAVVEVPTGQENDIFSDGRVLRAPLPAVAVGSVVEYVITHKSKSPIPGAGTAVHYAFGGYIPIERTRIVIDAPADFELRAINRTGVTPRVEEKAGRRRTVYEADRFEGQRETDQNVPYDVSVHPYLSFSTGKSWQEIATRYAAVVDQQIAGNDLQALVRGAVGNATDRREIVTRLLAAVQKDVRYAGVEIGEGSIVPRTPRQVLANKYGDCKDKAALLVAMLRTAGLTAHVALLNAGYGFDAPAALPSLAYFNHAIVVVEGEPAIWVDPTDVFARADELPLADQGRMALIAKAGTTTLTATPETPSTAHVYRERRTFVLPEEGKATITELSEPSGPSEAAMRRWVSGLDAKKLREDMEGYAKSTYVAKSLTRFETTPAKDLSVPFRLTLVIPESKSGIVYNGEGAVAINVGALPKQVPDILSNWREVQPGESADDLPKKRTHDFLFSNPQVREWVYRIVLPTGYAPRTLPPTETKKLGTITYSQELHAEADNTIVATFRFDSGKRRLNATEFEETRIAFTKFVTDNVLQIGFDHIGQTKLNAGDVRGALDEFRRLASLHAKEAQHHIEIARALLTGGLGDAAQKEARLAVAIEPKNALAHQTLANVLLHDSLGRPYRRGFDRKGAIAELRKAKELDPDDYDIRYALESALTYNDEGYRFGRGASLAEAAAEVQAAAKDLGDDGKRMLPELTLIYAHMGRFADLRAVAPTFVDQQQRELALIIATTGLEGVAAATKELGAYNQQVKRGYASGTGQLMMQVRRYPEAAALMDLATQGTAEAAEQRPMIDMLAKLKRVEDLPVDNSPRGFIPLFLDALVHRDVVRMKQIVPADLLDKPEDMEEFAEMDLRPPDDLPMEVFLDLLPTVIEVQMDGDESTGYRLRMRTRGAPSADDDMSMMVRRENGRFVLRGISKEPGTSGLTVLAMVAKGELEAGRKWLNWLREEVKAGSSDDPLEGAPFAALWPKSKASATADELRTAAAALASNKPENEAILLAAREHAGTDAARNAIDMALLLGHQERKEWPRMLTVTTRLVAANPDSAAAFSRHIDALLRNGKTTDAIGLANQRLERLPNDHDALRALVLSASETGDYVAAQKYATKIVDDLRPKTDDVNRAAWMALFTGQQLERAIEIAQQASKEKSIKDEKEEETGPGTALAALYAETGRSVEARTALLEAIDADNVGKLRPRDWYVLGRIAENYGVHEFAIDAYGKADKERTAGSIAELAHRRLEGLQKIKPKKP